MLNIAGAHMNNQLMTSKIVELSGEWSLIVSSAQEGDKLVAKTIKNLLEKGKPTFLLLKI